MIWNLRVSLVVGRAGAFVGVILAWFQETNPRTRPVLQEIPATQRITPRQEEALHAPVRIIGGCFVLLFAFACLLGSDEVTCNCDLTR